jgi:F-type H+-transporting ATPase subunit gamma
MKRAHILRRRLRSLDMLSEAVGAMKSLSAHHFRAARAALPAARAYRQGIDVALAAIGLHQRIFPGDANAILVIAADLGLCGGYNAQLAAAAMDAHDKLRVQRVYCVGRRPLTLLRREGVNVDRHYEAPTGVAGLTELLLRVGEDLITDYLTGGFGTLDVISARFEGVGSFTPTSTRLLPIDSPPSTSAMQPSIYASPDHLAAVAVREYLYIRLFQASLDSLASEHGARLVATESAGQWLSEKIDAARRQLASIRRELATQEVLDIAATARHRKTNDPTA